MPRRISISILGVAVAAVGILAIDPSIANTESVQQEKFDRDGWSGHYVAYKRDWKGRYNADPRRNSFTIERDDDAFVHRINGLPRRERLREERNSLVPIGPDGGLRALVREKSVIRVDYCYETVFLVREKRLDDWVVIDCEYDTTQTL